ncbi:hypothetical protein Bca4012_006387 [Brassica carinata]
MTESKITRRVLADLQAQIYTLTTIVQSMIVQLFPPTNDVYVEVDDAESKEEDNLEIYDDPVYDEYEDESEEDLCKEIYGSPIFDSYDDGDGDVPLKGYGEVFTQSVAPIYDLYDDEIEQVTVYRVEDESLIFDCPIYDTEALTHSQKSGFNGSILSHEDFTASYDVTWNYYFKDTFTSLRTISTGSEGRELFYWLSSIHSEKEDHTDDIIRETPVCVQFFDESKADTHRQLSKEPPDRDHNDSVSIHRENSTGKLVERLLFLKTWFNTKHSYITFNFGDVIVLMARQIDLKSAYNHYGEETRSYYETCEGLFASPVMQRKCDFDDKQFAVFVLLVEHVSIRSLGRFCWGRLGENMFFLTPEDPMIVFASLHVLDCIGLEHLVLFSSRSAFHFDLTDPILRPLLYLWLRIFSGIMTGNTYVVSTQQGWITDMFSSQVKPASLTAHFVLQATLSFFKSVVNVWDGTEVENSGTNQAQQKGASVDMVTVAESSNSPKGSATPNEVIVDPGLVFPKPTFSLGLTQEQPKKGNSSSVVINKESRGIVVNEDCIGVQAPDPEAPCHPCRKSKRQKVVPKALVGDYKCEKTFLSRAWEAHVASKSSDDSIELAAKFSQLIEMLKSPL